MRGESSSSEEENFDERTEGLKVNFFLIQQKNLKVKKGFNRLSSAVWQDTAAKLKTLQDFYRRKHEVAKKGISMPNFAGIDKSETIPHMVRIRQRFSVSRH